MSPQVQLAFKSFTCALKAAGETTRLRILALLVETDLTVSDLTGILAQSQPRISRHLRLMLQAGLVERFREGSWAFFRLGAHGGPAELARDLITRLDAADPILARDRERLASMRGPRAAAHRYRHASESDRVRNLQVADETVERSILANAAANEVA